MQALTTILALAIGLHLAVALMLVAHYVELRAAYALWWVAGAAALAARAVVDLGALAPAAPLPLVLLRTTLLLAGAGFFLTASVSRDPRSRGIVVVGTLGFGALLVAVIAALLLSAPADPGQAALARDIAGLAAGAAFLLAAEGYRRAEQILDDLATRLIFGGLIIAGLNFIAWAWTPWTAQAATISELLGGLFILVFGAGVVLRSMQRARRLIILSQLSTALHQPNGVHELLGDVLERAGELLQLHTGWVFLRRPGTDAYELAAAYHLPRPLEADGREAMRGTCRCLDLLAGHQLTEPVNIVNCMRLEGVGSAAQHASVPLRTSKGIAGLMNLVLPAGRLFGHRELALLATVGGEVGLAIEKAQLLEELAVKERSRGELIKRLLTAQEDERRRIARELHDETGQSITALIVNLDIARAAAEGVPQIAEALDRLKDLAEGTLEEVRKLIYDLRPTVLDDLGLTSALRWYAHQQLEPRGIEVEFHNHVGETRLETVVETTLFRIAQEAMWNVVKHSGATRVELGLDLIPDGVRLRVQDNGRGFRPDGERPFDPLRGGLGLGGMRERAALIGGTVKIWSGEGRGTEVVAELPTAAPGAPA
ncbi:MAG TPA: GAF domain-containing sensor histidine kinase [bacterium]|nr:GAF domain-containing sensor histidine kinase [bacterium]